MLNNYSKWSVLVMWYDVKCVLLAKKIKYYDS